MLFAVQFCLESYYYFFFQLTIWEKFKLKIWEEGWEMVKMVQNALWNASEKFWCYSNALSYKFDTIFPRLPFNVKEVHSCFLELRFLFLGKQSTRHLQENLYISYKAILLCKTNCIYRSFSPQSVSLSKSGSKNPKNQTHSQKSSGSLGDNTPFAARVSKGRELNGWC